MKRSVCVLVSLFLLSAPSLALGPVSFTLYGGVTSPISGTIIGANAALSLPLLPGLGAELESGSGSVSGVNYTGTRVGLLYKGFLGFLNLSLGSENINLSGPLSGFSLPGGNLSGSYIGLGIEIGIMSVVVNPRLVLSTFSQGSIPWVNITIGYKF